ncbi:hypothetical protein F3J19_14235 [Burkholderia sp. Ax-1724]|nr:hypothetical protein [Burkholderia sp. Ax-1724]NIF76811.1 hypothetical protein [Paraburkholderia sp. Cy-641]
MSRSGCDPLSQGDVMKQRTHPGTTILFCAIKENPRRRNCRTRAGARKATAGGPGRGMAASGERWSVACCGARPTRKKALIEGCRCGGVPTLASAGEGEEKGSARADGNADAMRLTR